ncbi:hypothetical protein C5167_036400 [Papaver somniferum]|uniref:Uncharacterized protein n=1 Tax=Papaver somniferum TaxID=3469 RepID=A0A4Y7I3N1_PAPSO|nr:hypothetical protein C5167_036400 [Papaver somniferum]
MQVECPGFCITHQRKDYPYIEIFRSNEQEAANQGKTNDANTTKYAVRVVHLTLTSSSFQTSS